MLLSLLHTPAVFEPFVDSIFLCFLFFCIDEPYVGLHEMNQYAVGFLKKSPRISLFLSIIVGGIKLALRYVSPDHGFSIIIRIFLYLHIAYIFINIV